MQSPSNSPANNPEQPNTTQIPGAPAYFCTPLEAMAWAQAQLAQQQQQMGGQQAAYGHHQQTPGHYGPQQAPSFPHYAHPTAYGYYPAPTMAYHPPAAMHYSPMATHVNPQQHQEQNALASFFNFRDERFLKGAITGAALAFLLTNEPLQKNAVKSVMKLWNSLQSGVEEFKERIQDIDAEIQAEESQKK